MTKKTTQKRGVSWELIGVFVLAAVFLVGALIWVGGGGGGSDLKEPDFSSTLKGAIPSGLTADGKPYLGNPNAAVTVTEFADFQCPHCKDYTVNESKAIKDDYVANGKAKIIFMNFPLRGDDSVLAASGAACAGDQGKFWEMHDWLFANQPEVPNSGAFARENLIKIAAKVGVKQDAFTKCIDDPATKQRVQAEKDVGVAKSVDATPSFLIGDVRVAGGDVAKIREALDKALAK